jgi:hypothetical protein
MLQILSFNLLILMLTIGIYLCYYVAHFHVKYVKLIGRVTFVHAYQLHLFFFSSSFNMRLPRILDTVKLTLEQNC